MTYSNTIQSQPSPIVPFLIIGSISALGAITMLAMEAALFVNILLGAWIITPVLILAYKMFNLYIEDKKDPKFDIQELFQRAFKELWEESDRSVNTLITCFAKRFNVSDADITRILEKKDNLKDLVKEMYNYVQDLWTEPQTSLDVLIQNVQQVVEPIKLQIRESVSDIVSPLLNNVYKYQQQFTDSMKNNSVFKAFNF